MSIISGESHLGISYTDLVSGSKFAKVGQSPGPNKDSEYWLGMSVYAMSSNPANFCSNLKKAVVSNPVGICYQISTAHVVDTRTCNLCNKTTSFSRHGLWNLL